MIVSFIYCNTKIVKDFDICKLIVTNLIYIEGAITAIFLYYSTQSDG